MNKEQIEYYIGDIGYLVNDLIESKEKKKEILTHLRNLVIQVILKRQFRI